MKNFILKSLELYSEDNDYYLKVVYETVDKYKRTEITIPKIKLPIRNFAPDITSTSPTNRYIPVIEHYINMGFGNLPMLPFDDDNHVIVEKVVEEYPQKMTLEEIEKKLGYKVELVSKKEK